MIESERCLLGTQLDDDLPTTLAAECRDRSEHAARSARPRTAHLDLRDRAGRSHRARGQGRLTVSGSPNKSLSSRQCSRLRILLNATNVEVVSGLLNICLVVDGL
jgi:hypothetical protein